MSPTHSTSRPELEATQVQPEAKEPAESPSASEAAGLLVGLRFVVTVGPDRGKSAPCHGERFTVGTALENDLVLTDPTVSRRQCELLATPGGLRLRDLNSTNGTRLGGCRVESAYIRPGASIRVGGSIVGLESIRRAEAGATASRGDRRQPRALGKSPAMLKILSVLARVSRYDSTVLLEGETGTARPCSRAPYTSRARARAAPSWWSTAARFHRR